MQQGKVIWLMGLAGSGKSTLGKALHDKVWQTYKNVVFLDGDEMRELLGVGGYDKDSRISFGKKYFQFAKFLSNQGLIVIVSAIGMFNEIYEFNRANLSNYVEIYVKCDFDELARRDKKGLYTGALSGDVKDVVGVDISFDEPQADFVIDNSLRDNLDKKVDEIYSFLKL
ncbi:adenylyl-sulfate kinase [Helicobacter saguini]|uniref:Adenylyl-sulfate kinase n=1 Tax=Helicobacter saguini TaxID=1548018 RepID=A0A347VND6_9HELI|nr:adenylyl-sulfate kinase [Helicobacter saguini]MWV61809.1 adenylyl-sulfate kinase [Helicobacter saguini]MWV67516.1 adenylyl-sulfate kinase [Helicobacter saguini]MWV69867.1 adenylyl-sulfate kinase [Helicobacter saguini]MWV72915.1 adenylyl-sulfate kinase [Helicobacter saguini]TLD93267.1 adenylyl-sulfate kinase [Helicobacter saguini]